MKTNLTVKTYGRCSQNNCLEGVEILQDDPIDVSQCIRVVSLEIRPCLNLFNTKCSKGFSLEVPTNNMLRVL